MTIVARFIAPLVAAAAAGSIVLAPAAAAAPGPVPATSNPSGCREAGGARMCSKQGHSSMHAKPTPRNPNGSLFSSAWLPGYGKGILPPLIALD
jgi:hypothetical protein